MRYAIQLNSFFGDMQKYKFVLIGHIYSTAVLGSENTEGYHPCQRSQRFDFSAYALRFYSSYYISPEKCLCVQTDFGRDRLYLELAKLTASSTFCIFLLGN